MRHGGKNLYINNMVNLAHVTKRIDYDIKHRVEKQEVLDFLELVKTDES